MPISKSEKQQFKELIISILGAQLVLRKQLSPLSTNDLIVLLASLETFHYINPRLPIPKSVHWLETVLPSEDFGAKRFRQQFRMDPETFCEVLKLIQDTSPFTNAQEPVPMQLVVALYNLGSFGNAKSIGHIATKFGTSEGCVQNFTFRVVTALNELSETWIKWPSPSERRSIGNSMAAAFFPNCVGFIDGSDATFYQAPQNDKETYWSRKKKYCMQFQIVCDPQRLIRNLFTGYPGSVHDAKVYAASPVSTHAQLHFSGEEYILGDSAYPNSTSVIVPFRRKQGMLSRSQKTFNKQLSSKRVIVEHTIGILKGRFQCLLGLRINVNNREGHKNVCFWICACVVLHNMLQILDPWNRIDDDIYEEPDEDEDNEFNLNHTGEDKRIALSLMVNTMCN